MLQSDHPQNLATTSGAELATLSLTGLACDCHVHVVGPPERYPMLDERQYTPPTASVTQLRAHLSGQGLKRVVLIQPSFYGTDNQCLIDSLGALQDFARGVAVIAPETSDEQILTLHQQGVRGLRINVESSHQGDAQPLALLPYWSKRLAALNLLSRWHIQVFTSCANIVRYRAEIASCGATVVLDHFALLSLDADWAGEQEKQVLTLLQQGKVWIKLSAAYRIGALQSSHTDKLSRLAKTLWNTNADRLVWGSDWPHTQRQPGMLPHQVSAHRSVDPKLLTEQIHACFPNSQALDMAMVTNPARLYDF
jgi:2-pyrone-4,6-dicarboxylate lactonase